MAQKNWKNDPRLQNMDPDKLNFLTDFVERIKKTPKNQVVPAFLSLQAEASQKGISFSNQETMLLVSILSSDMSPADKNRLEALRMLAKKVAAKS